jgi:hypothetical protein
MCFNASRSRLQLPKVLNTKFDLYSHRILSSICSNPYWTICFNPLNAELNPICHLLILLRDLTVMDKYIVNISNKMQCYTVYVYLETALHVSGGISTHHQELKQLYLRHLVFVTPLLLSAAIVEEL